MAIETVRIKDDTERGFKIINADEFDKETMEIADEPEQDQDNELSTKEQIEADLKDVSDDKFNETLAKMDKGHLSGTLSALEVDYNKNLGEAKLRETLTAVRAELLEQ